MEEFRTLVLYKTKHGTTKRYADWLGDALDADVVDVSKMSPSDWGLKMTRYDMVLYGGNLNERGINGLQQFKAVLQKNPVENIAYFCVGSYPASEQTRDQHLESNFTAKEREDTKLFYFRGRLDFIGLGWIEKKIMGGLMKAIEKKYPEDRTPEEAEIIEAYYDDVDWSDKSYIAPLVAYVKSFMTAEQLADLQPRADAKMAERLILEAEEAAAWEAEMQRREELFKANQEKQERDKIKRMSKKQKAAYLARKAAEAQQNEDEIDEALLTEGEAADDYSEFDETQDE